MLTMLLLILLYVALVAIVIGVLGFICYYTVLFVAEIIYDFRKSKRPRPRISFRSAANNKFVTVRNCGAEVLASEDNCNRYLEHFIPCFNKDGTISFIADCNGKYLSVRFDDPNHSLRATADVVDTWEKFTIEKVDDSPCLHLLKTIKDGWYVQADLSNGGVLRAKESSPQGWERFSIVNFELIEKKVAKHQRRPGPFFTKTSRRISS